MQLKIIITGATGFVGEGVLLECLENKNVQEVLMVNRKHFDLAHPKLKELLIPDFMQPDGYDDTQLTGYDACLYCAGISSLGMKEEEYAHITYDTTIAFANRLLSLNPGITFNFISGSHTDGSAKGKVMWARVKGKTENALRAMPFKKQYSFRPGGMKAIGEQKNAKTGYKIIIAILSAIIPKQLCSLHEVGRAMINAAIKGYSKQVLEIADIKQLAKE